MKKVFFVMVVLFLGVGGYWCYQIWSAANQVYVPPKQVKSEKRDKPVEVGHDPVSLLLLGVDERPGDRGRADTMLLVTVNPKTKSAQMLSIPRDTLVSIPGVKQDKINHSYAFGGVDLSRKTVENFLDIPVDGYIKVNMQGLQKAVDLLGGVDVEVPFDFTFSEEKTFMFKKGRMHLNGEQALAFSRMRKEDPNGDFGRNQRQQEVIKAMLRKAVSMESIGALDDWLGSLGSTIQTDLSPMQWWKLKDDLSGIDQSDIQTDRLHGKGVKINGIYYLKVDEKERNRIRSWLAKHLEL